MSWPASRARCRAFERADFDVPDDVMTVYLDAVTRIAEAEIAGVPTESAEAAVRYVVLGSVLVEPLLLALRRVAQQVASARAVRRCRRSRGLDLDVRSAWSDVANPSHAVPACAMIEPCTWRSRPAPRPMEMRRRTTRTAR